MIISFLKRLSNNRAYLNVAIFGAFACSAILIFWPILFGGKIINDFFGLDLAHYKFLSDFISGLKQNHFQLWWPNYLGGFPAYLTQVGFFSPLVFILYKFSSGFPVYQWLIFFNFLLSGLAMYWFSRNLSLSKVSSITVGLAYMLSQNNIYWGPVFPFTSIYPFIPLFFGALLKIYQGKNRWWFFTPFIVAYGLVGNDAQVAFYTLVVGLFWALFLYTQNKDYKVVIGYFVTAFAGVILASFWLLPTFNYLKFTTRSSALSFADLTFDFMRIADPLRFFYPYIQLPQFTGFESLGIVPNYYIGVLIFLLAVSTVFFIRKNKVLAFWFGVALFSTLVRIEWTGIFWVLHFLPGFNRFRGVFHWSFMGSFALALLAGFALDNLDKIKESRYFGKFITTLKFFVLANVIFTVVVFLTGFFRNQILNRIFQFFDTKIYQTTRQFPLEHYHSVIASEFNKFLNSFSLSNYHFAISFVSILFSVLILILYQKGRINFANFKKIALVFTFFNLVLIWQGYYEFIPQSKIINYPDTVSFIKNNHPEGEQYRFFRFYPPESYQTFEVFNVKDWTDYKLKTMESNIGVYFGMDTFGGVEPFLSGRIANVFDEIGFERPSTISGEPWLRSTKLSLDQKIQKFSSSKNQALFSMLNIKYIFSSFKLPNFKLIYQTTATEKNIPVYIYENPQVIPRIYFAKNVKFVDSNNAFGELLKIKDFHEITLIEINPKSQIPDTKYQIQNTKTEVKSFEFQLIKLKTQGEGWLVYSDANLPTWEAYIDNQQTPIYTANYLFKSVFVPKGEHEVLFKYPGLWGQDKAALKSILDLQ